MLLLLHDNACGVVAETKEEKCLIVLETEQG
jgi:hypothetical protein